MSPRTASAPTYSAAAPCIHGSARLAQRRRGSARGWQAAAPMHATGSLKRGVLCSGWAKCRALSHGSTNGNMCLCLSYVQRTEHYRG